MSLSNETVEIEDVEEGQIRAIRLNRPDKLNALNKQLLSEFANSIGNADQEGVKVLILEGSGDAFSAGIDLDEVAEKEESGSPDILLWLQKVSKLIWNYDGIVISQLHGYVVGAGFEISLACDLRFASSDAKFKFPELGIGITLTNGSTKTLPELVGRGMAKKLVLSGEEISAQTAKELEIVEEVVDDELPSRVREFAHKVSDYPTSALVLTKHGLNNRKGKDFEQVLNVETMDILEIMMG